MKNLFKLFMLLVLVSSLSFIGCTNPFSPGTAQLTIINNTGADIDFVEWNGIKFGDDDVWDAYYHLTVKGIAAGSKSTQEVNAGGGYIKYYIATNTSDIEYSSNPISIEKGKHLEYTFN